MTSPKSVACATRKTDDVGGWDRAEERLDELVELDDALQRLERFDERLCKVVECRFFGGMTVEETAAALELAPRTVDRAWQKAKAWLYREIHEAQAPVAITRLMTGNNS